MISTPRQLISTPRQHGLARGARRRGVPTSPPAQPTVAVVGLGYVGLPTAIALAQAGLDVIGLDSWPQRLEAIKDGRVDLFAAELECLQLQLREQRLQLTSESKTLSAADVIIICVPTPVDEHSQPDLRILREACQMVVDVARAQQTIILTSTTYVGSARELLVEPLNSRRLRVGENVFVAFSPERINPGVVEHTQSTTPRVVGGYSTTCCERAAQVLSHSCQSLHRVSSLEAAELTKLYENTFRAVNIALSFEMADACRHYGLDVVEVTDAAATKPYAFMAHYPSAGVGGHCIGVDPHYLVQPLQAEGVMVPMVEQALTLIGGRPHRVSQRSLEILEQLGIAPATARVLVVGVAYKPDVMDMREAPAMTLIAQLANAGVCVEYFDPLIPQLQVKEHAYQHIACPQAAAYDLAVITTTHSNISYEWLREYENVLDCTYHTPGGKTRFVI